MESDSANRLIGETSPYLLQHAHNPVDWYPWGTEALAKARREDKPIFLSIGYSACHWCHVMAHESFADTAIAEIMNTCFVNIKVDREERPDVDAVYMKAVIALVGQGGWPLSVFLTPDQKPYFGGTYFPPGARFGRPGFTEVLRQAHDLYRQGKDSTRARAEALLLRIVPRVQDKRATDDLPGAELIDEAVAIMAERFDAEQGGFGNGMKFPEPMSHGLLLRHWRRSGSSDSVLMADKTLTRMAEGGIYDQLGGGFHRYSTDRRWLVPHFEKMLYDNALLAQLHLEMFQATRQEIYQTAPREIFAYVSREMTSPDGGFYSSQDADTTDGEGAYFVWDMKEILDVLGPKNAKVFCRRYGVSANGNFERKNILHIVESMEAIAEAEGLPIFEVNHILHVGRQALLERRQQRPAPGRDEKILTGWNGMMIGALASGFAVLRDRVYLDSAVAGGEFVWAKLWTPDGLLRVWKDGRAAIPAFLDDYAFLLDGFINLYEASLAPVWIQRSSALADHLLEEFWDDKDGGFFLAGKRHEALVTQIKSGSDEAVPSANSVAALSLLRLGRLTGDDRFWRRGEETVKAFSAGIRQRPAGHNGFLAAVDFLTRPTTEIVFAGPVEGDAYDEMARVAHQEFRPNKIVLHSGGGGEGELAPGRGKAAIQGLPTVYLCQNQTCHSPVQSGAALSNLLERAPVIRLNIFDEKKALADKTAKETASFLNVMGKIFEQSGITKKRQ
jgi:hypothetical protein